MRTRISASLALVVGGLAAVLAGGPNQVAAQDKAKPAPKFLYGHDVRVRTGGTKDFDEKTPRVAVEVFQDDNTKTIVAITEAGAIAAVPAAEVGGDKTCKWLTAHDLKARKVGEAEFTQKTKVYGVELFRDAASNRLLYVCESGSLAFAPVPANLVTDKGPKWHHALEPKVRGPEQPSFDSAKKHSLEVFKDENTGGLVYVTETGAIATAPAPATAPDPTKVAPPKTMYGLVLRVRAADELDFSEKTKRIGVEVFEDSNAGVMLFVTQAGYVATAPLTKLKEAKGVTWQGAMNLKARKAGEADFEKAKKFGVEVFQDNRTGYQILIGETGTIAVVAK
ncbi:MAG TPA: hypothetical protein VMZ71_09710 [Gemmataceae bacterium]|nr:hypothetical protein [Gemmataceae bacterium]